MRIQHNIMAMNAYRNYNTNTKALSGNLEKLSSGYKINRAGDDAAGLAISEKMRAQITGLDAAQKNVKDGISLVKTAEGAMQEIQDMLNRMDYLATQSANGTYDSAVDRTNLQKEVNALRSEINRIADSANFNGIKLLDGSIAGVKAQAAYTEQLAGGDANGVDRLLTSDVSANAAQNNSKVVFDKYAENATKGSFSIDFSKLELKTKLGEAAAAKASGVASYQADVGTLTFKIGDKTITVNSNHFASSALKVTAGSGVISANATISAASVAKAVMTALANKTGGAGSKATVEINGVQWKASLSGTKITFTQKQKPETVEEAQVNFNVSVTHNPSTPVSAGAAVKNLGTINMQDGVSIIKEGVPEGAKKGAEAVYKLEESDIRDNTRITLGSKTYTIRLGADSTVSATTSNLIDMSSYEMGDKGLLNIALAKLGIKIGSTTSFTVATAKGGTTSVTFDVSIREDGIAVKRHTAPASAGQVYFKKLEDFKDYFKVVAPETKVEHAAVKEEGGLKLQIGDTADSFNQMGVHVGDMHVSAMGFDLDSKGEITKTGKSIADIDIGTQEGAADAIQTIKNAINYVSGIRGDLGAVQNRLEHTGNNLSVMAENIQDAESTIRDTDVAAEMMKYVKNNILVQSAQAMLAQANQVPQGVLQLLG